MKDKTILLYIVIVIVVIGGIFVIRANSEPRSSSATGEPGPYDSFAQCINDSGAKFYGAYWCPHCADQKEMFGNSERLLPYVECSTPNAQGQTAQCAQAGVESYPTWELSDGTRLPGVQSFKQLSDATGCVLPE
jgi:hypothetical protein